MHYRDLDGLRGILSVTVMLYHFGLNTVLSRITGGLIADAPWALCVDFFFVLSGFVLCHSFMRRPLTIRQYAIKRVWRLVPVHLVILLPLLPILVMEFDPTVPEILINLTLAQAAFGMDSINPPSWSASLELVVPALFVIVWASFTALKRPALIALLLIGIIGASIASYELVETAGWNVVRALASLTIGFVLYRLVEGRISPRKGLWPTLLSLGCIALLFLAIMAIDIWPLIGLAYPLIVILTVLVVANSDSLLSRGPLRFLGEWSYTIYMVHMPALLLCLYLFGERMDGSLAYKAGAIMACIAASALITRYVEKPLMRYGSALIRA
ncbi:hypothetical protein GCM10009127_22220 [Alteraurantiacibacter aestuarii]